MCYLVSLPWKEEGGLQVYAFFSNLLYRHVRLMIELLLCYLVNLPWKTEGHLQVGDFFSKFHHGH